MVINTGKSSLSTGRLTSLLYLVHYVLIRQGFLA